MGTRDVPQIAPILPSEAAQHDPVREGADPHSPGKVVTEGFRLVRLWPQKTV